MMMIGALPLHRIPTAECAEACMVVVRCHLWTDWRWTFEHDGTTMWTMQCNASILPAGLLLLALPTHPSAPLLRNY